MDPEIQEALDNLKAGLDELHVIVSSHRAMLSQHQTALNTVAQIMERGRGLETIL